MLSGTISVEGTTSIVMFLVAVEFVEHVGEGVLLEFCEVIQDCLLGGIEVRKASMGYGSLLGSFEGIY